MLKTVIKCFEKREQLENSWLKNNVPVGRSICRKLFKVV